MNPIAIAVVVAIPIPVLRGRERGQCYQHKNREHQSDACRARLPRRFAG
jgi:hypothetical protein